MNASQLNCTHHHGGSINENAHNMCKKHVRGLKNQRSIKRFGSTDEVLRHNINLSAVKRIRKELKTMPQKYTKSEHTATAEIWQQYDSTTGLDGLREKLMEANSGHGQLKFEFDTSLSKYFKGFDQSKSVKKKSGVDRYCEEILLNVVFEAQSQDASKYPDADALLKDKELLQRMRAELGNRMTQKEIKRFVRRYAQSSGCVDADDDTMYQLEDEKDEVDRNGLYNFEKYIDFRCFKYVQHIFLSVYL